MPPAGTPASSRFADLADHQFGLLPIEPAFPVRFKLLVVAGPGRVDQLDGQFRQPRGDCPDFRRFPFSTIACWLVGENGTVPLDAANGRQIAKPMFADRFVGLKLAIVKLPRGEIRDRLVHAILHRQPPCDVRSVMADQPLEEARAKTGRRGLLADDRGRQLTMIAGQHEAVAAQERDPTARLGALARLVNYHEIEAPRAEELAIDAGGRGADHRRRIQDAFGRLLLHLPRVGQERAGVVAKLPPLARLGRRAALFARLAEETHRLLDQFAGEFHVGVLFHQQVEGVFAQLRQHAGRMAQANRPFAERQQLLEDVIDRHIAPARTEPALSARDERLGE